MENQNHVETRWQPSSREFSQVVSIIEASEMQGRVRCKGKLLGVAKERLFYLNTLRHHADQRMNVLLPRVYVTVQVGRNKPREYQSSYPHQPTRLSNYLKTTKIA